MQTGKFIGFTKYLHFFAFFILLKCLFGDLAQNCYNLNIDRAKTTLRIMYFWSNDPQKWEYELVNFISAH